MHQVGQRVVLDHHPLGLAGGAGGVDHIGQLLRAQPRSLWVAVVRSTGADVVQVQARHLGRQPIYRSLAHDQCRGTVSQQVGNALSWVRRVHRHVGRARFKHCQQRNHAPAVARQAQGHAVPHLNAAFDQLVSQLVGTAVEFVVTQRLAILQQRNRCWRGGGTGLDHGVYGLPLRIKLGGVVELLQYLITLGRRQYLQPLQRCRGGVFQGVDQACQHLFELRAQA